jgi:cbb3-type cytochrome oxidase cytochrome c subunit
MVYLYFFSSSLHQLPNVIPTFKLPSYSNIPKKKKQAKKTKNKKEMNEKRKERVGYIAKLGECAKKKQESKRGQNKSKIDMCYILKKTNETL